MYGILQVPSDILVAALRGHAVWRPVGGPVGGPVGLGEVVWDAPRRDFGAKKPTGAPCGHAYRGDRAHRLDPHD